jgi:hypothetical protein
MEASTAFALVLLIILVLAFVGLAVVVVMGHVYMTSLAFGHTTDGDDRTYALKDWQVHMAKVAMVSFWVSLALQVANATFWVYRSTA